MDTIIKHENSERTVLGNSLSVNKEEHVLLITDDISVAKFFSAEAKLIGAAINVIILCEEIRPIQHLSKPLYETVRASNVILTAFRKHPGELYFRRELIDTILKTPSIERCQKQSNMRRDLERFTWR